MDFLRLAPGATAVIVGAMLATPVHAQRCVSAGDRADNAAQNRYCGADLITTTLGGAPLGGTAGFGSDTSCLSQNDDGSGPSIPIGAYFPGGLRFFTRTHTSLYVNTNGNITFSGPVSTFTPDAFPVADQPMIAPFWADVDTRRADGSCTESIGLTCTTCTPCYATSANQVWWHFETGRAIFTWDEVGYYNCRDDRRQSFQLILTAAPGCGDGDFDVEFRYNRCEWDTGDASGGSGGFLTSTFGGAAAQAGFDAGDGTNYVEIMRSRMTREINRTLCEESNVGEPGVWRFQIRSGAVMCPEAGMPCSTGMMGACGEGRISCDCSGASCTTSCVPQVTPREERCNALDDDCDGTADDEGEGPLCAAEQMCIRGRCVARCFEGGCEAGYECTAEGCVEAACVGMTCPEGQRCRGGSCVPGCEGVVCPAPQTCIAGACVDTCAGLTCDDCTTCEGGSCVARCDRGGSCGAGESCDPMGRCVETACVGVSCSAGTYCRGGACVDSCTDAVCPEGDMCVGGECVPIPPPDAGVPMPRDAAGVDGGGGPIDGGGGTFDAGIDGGRARPPRMGGGCSCTVAGADGGGHGAGAIALSILALGLVLGRRRR